MQRAIADQGQTADLWSLEAEDSANGSQYLVEHYFKPYFKILNDCQKVSTCVGPTKYKYLNGINHIAYNGQSYYKHIILSDGTLLIFHVSSQFETCGTNRNSNCAEIFVDTNGYFHGPNQFGKDFFMFGMKKDRIVPLYPPAEKPSIQTTCSKSNYGNGCAAWVILNENMDYLHCNDLEWNTKTSCK